MSRVTFVDFDEVATTTRAVRKRLDLDRPVEPELITECLRIGVQAPTGSNAQSWRFVVVTDPEKRAALAECYRVGWEKAYGGGAAAMARVPEERRAQQERVRSSSQYLADNLHRVPVHVIPCGLGRPREGTAAAWPGFLGSLIPAVWSFQMALRSRGLGSVYTTLHLFEAAKAAQVLGIPDNVTQVALIPVAYTKGTDFKPATRRPVEEITYWNQWKSP